MRKIVAACLLFFGLCGTASAGQIIVDANNQFVGTTVAPGNSAPTQYFLMYPPNGDAVLISDGVGPSGIGAGSGSDSITEYYTTANCSGTAYLVLSGLPEPAFIESASRSPGTYPTITDTFTLKYPGLTVSVQTIVATITNGGSCTALTSQSIYVAPEQAQSYTFVGPYSIIP